MDKYLIAILKEVNTIIIPGIGALTIVNQATGEVMFMSFMKFDDGKLAEHIAQKENWELNDAKNLVSKYVRDINTKLDQGDTYDIYQFGTFSKNSDSEIEFTTWDGLSASSSDTNEVGSSISENTPESEESLKEEIVEDITEEVDEINPILEKLEDIQEDAEESIDESSEEVDDIKAEETENTIEGITDLIEDVIIPSPKPEVNQNISESITPAAPISEEEQWKDDLDIPPINVKKELPKKPILEKTKKDTIKKKRGVGFYILMILLVLVIGGGTYIAMNYNDLKQHIPFLAETAPKDSEAITESQEEESIVEEENETEEEEVLEEETSNQEEIVESKPVAAPVTSSNGLTINQSLPVQIIVGSFSEESNAQRKITQLKESGIHAELIGRYDGLHLVSIASFNTSSEVKVHTETIKSAAGTYWIFKK